MLSFKNLFVPKDNATKEVQVVQLWYVRWQSHLGTWPMSREHNVMEAFTSEADAQEFATSLRKASILLKDSTRNVTVEKN